MRYVVFCEVPSRYMRDGLERVIDQRSLVACLDHAYATPGGVEGWFEVRPHGDVFQVAFLREDVAGEGIPSTIEQLATELDSAEYQVGGDGGLKPDETLFVAEVVGHVANSLRANGWMPFNPSEFGR